MTTSAEHAAINDAAAFWNQFPEPWDPKVGDTVKGTVMRLSEERGVAGKVPVVVIRTDDNETVVVLVGTKNLLRAMKDLKPKVGDQIKIRYKGEESSAAPGYKPAKLWAVAVRGDVTETGP